MKCISIFSALGRLAVAAAFTVAAGASAQQASGVSGDWTFGTDATLAGAATTNAEGSTFGMVCTVNCINYVDSDQPCDDGVGYQGRLSSAAGEFEVTMTCRHLVGRYVLTMNPDEDFLRMIAESGEFTLSVPHPDGPRVFVFSLRGAYPALSLTIAAAMLLPGAPQGAQGGPE